MKKSIISVFTALLLASAAGAQNVSLTNTFGGNDDNVGTSDFLKFDKDGNKQDAIVGDRIQLDVASENVDARVRLNISGDKNYAPGLQAYANVRPVQPLNIIGGNKFFWKWATSPAYLSAIDDYLTHGKLADDNGAGLVLNIAPESSDIGFKFASAAGSQSRLDLNFGAEFSIKNIVTISATAQDVTEKTRSLGAYVGLNSVKNLILNAGYTYNNSDENYIQGTQNLIQFSVGYTFEELKISLYADLLAGLSNKSSFTTATDDFAELENGIPLTAVVRANYKANEKLDFYTSVKFNHILLADSTSDTVTLYPYFDYYTSLGTIRSGLRVFFNDKDGFNGFNIPFSWQYKISK
ncbi:hypothetical protein MSI_06490 [Treponema sp. JC4]|uniref:hypothetical protein n=1 Tax=Treponema sp. JC4 TaxID=1124982 RepID=UPI00025AFB91|nr:hypothetical protein [Treponema sp. JC4]EID85830.1 hypothetical protein MSI_06490 [Treponema sp. JC4]